MVESATAIDKLKQDFLAKLEVQKSSYQEHVRMAVDKTGETPDNFKCNICQLLVCDPVECSNCDQLFCDECIKQWMKKGKQNCPLCQNNVTPNPINRILKKYLDQTLLKGCPVPDCDHAET